MENVSPVFVCSLAEYGKSYEWNFIIIWE